MPGRRDLGWLIGSAMCMKLNNRWTKCHALNRTTVHNRSQLEGQEGRFIATMCSWLVFNLMCGVLASCSGSDVDDVTGFIDNSNGHIASTGGTTGLQHALKALEALC